MIKNAFIYRIVTAPIDKSIELGLKAHAFVPCQPSQEKSVGWVPPRGHDHGALLESVGSQWILKLMMETKAVPASVVKREAQEKCSQIEASTGRKPGKKEKREIMDDVRMSLLPMAFAKQSAVLIWIDLSAELLVIDASTQTKADEALSLLIKAVDGLVLQMINTQISPSAAMALWLQSMEAPEDFTVDRECELKACDESRAVVRYGRHALDIDEVVQHVTQGMLPTRLAMTFNNRVSFVLTEGLQLKKISILDIVFEQSAEKEGADDHFDADVAIMTGEVSKLLPALFEVLGGEIEPAQADIETAAAAPAYIGDGPDPLYETALDLVIKGHKASISYVQRHLRIGYNRAARLIETMEQSGYVSRMQSDGSRKVLT